MNSKEKIRICHVSTAHQADDDRIFLKECRSLAAAGYEVFYVVQASAEAVIDGVTIVPLKQRAGRISRMLIGPWEAFFKVLGTKSRIVHLHDPELLPMTFWFWLARKKVVFDSHEHVSNQILSKEWIGPTWIRKMVSFGYRVVEKFFVLFCSKVVGVIPEICELFPVHKRILLRNYPILELAGKSTRIYEPKNLISVIYAGGLSATRGILETIQAVSLLNGQAELVLLGKFNDESYFTTCKNHEGWKYVRFEGQVHPEAVYDYYDKADIGSALLYPSDKNYMNSLPVKSFEYMASGLPVLMSDIPYWRKFYAEGVIFVDMFNAQEVADRILELKNSSELRSELGTKGKKLAFANFSWETEFESLQKAYKEILDGH